MCCLGCQLHPLTEEENCGSREAPAETSVVRNLGSEVTGNICHRPIYKLKYDLGAELVINFISSSRLNLTLFCLLMLPVSRFHCGQQERLLDVRRIPAIQGPIRTLEEFVPKRAVHTNSENRKRKTDLFLKIRLFCTRFLCKARKVQ